MQSVYETIHPLFSQNNDLTWIAALMLSLLSTTAIKVVLKLLSVRLRKITRTTISVWDDVGVDIIDGLKSWTLFAWIFYFTVRSVRVTENTARALQTVVVVITITQVVIWGLYLIRKWHDAILFKKIKDDPSSSSAIGLLYRMIQFAFLAIVLLIGMSNLGINIGALLAGLGVGGIAVALAAQNVLGDLLASLSIVLDKPFVVGDFVVAGEEKGTVEHIGIKTTRLRSLSGEELILSNKDLLESRIHNFKRMSKRRVVLNFGIVYSTTASTVEKIPTWVKEIILNYPKLEFDRCHFMKYAASSLDYELVFFVLDADYNIYMDIQQAVLLDIFKKFEQEHVEFAYPTQSLFIEKFKANKGL